MGSKSDSQKEAALKAQNDAYAAQSAQAIAANKSSPYEDALNKEGMDWLDATNGKAPMDVASLPGMSPYIDIYNTASAKQQGQRYGLGSMKMGAEFANPNMLAAMAQQDQSHRTQDAGAQLESAYKQRDASVRGLAMPLINVDAGRDATNVAATTGLANTATNAWASHRIQPSFWASLLQNAAQGAGAAAIQAAA